MGFKMQKFTLKINLKFAFLEIVLLLKYTNEGINISAKKTGVWLGYSSSVAEGAPQTGIQICIFLC